MQEQPTEAWHQAWTWSERAWALLRPAALVSKFLPHCLWLCAVGSSLMFTVIDVLAHCGIAEIRGFACCLSPLWTSCICVSCMPNLCSILPSRIADYLRAYRGLHVCN